MGRFGLSEAGIVPPQEKVIIIIIIANVIDSLFSKRPCALILINPWEFYYSRHLSFRRRRGSHRFWNLTTSHRDGG